MPNPVPRTRWEPPHARRGLSGDVEESNERIMDGTMEVGVRTTESPRDLFGFRLIAPLALGSMLNPVNSTMISTALIPIARDFHATVAQTSWLIWWPLYHECNRPTHDGTPCRLSRRAPRLPCGLIFDCSCGHRRHLCALTSRADMGTGSSGDWYIRSLPDRDEDSSEPSGNDYVG